MLWASNPCILQCTVSVTPLACISCYLCLSKAAFSAVEVRGVRMSPLWRYFLPASVFSISVEKHVKAPMTWGRILHWWFFHWLWKINWCALAGKWLWHFWGLPVVSVCGPRFLCHLFHRWNQPKKSEQSLTVVFTCTFEVTFLQQSNVDQNAFRLGGDTKINF